MWKNWKGDKIKRDTAVNVAAALVRTGEATVAEVQRQVPLDEGTLQSTVMVIVDPTNPLNVVVSAGGGPGTGFQRVPYAIKWHEVPADFQHGRKHNYLRDPIKNFTPNALKRELKRAGSESWS